MKSTPTLTPGLRSPYDQVRGVVHFGRMLDKMKLHQAGQLPPDWVSAKGSPQGFDGRTCRFLHVDYAALETEALNGGSDEALFDWAVKTGRQPSESEIEYFNAFMTKMGWRDKYIERVQFRLQEVGLPIDSVVTMFDFIDLDEGRPPRFPV